MGATGAHRPNAFFFGVRTVKRKTAPEAPIDQTLLFSEFGVRSSELGVRSSEFGVRSSEFGARNSELRTPNSELRTPNSELRKKKRLVDGRLWRPSTKRTVFRLTVRTPKKKAFGRWAPLAPIDQTHCFSFNGPKGLADRVGR